MVLSDVPVKELPKCIWEGCNDDAHYDCPTALGSWGYLCERHYRMHGKSGGNRLFVLKEKSAKHIAGIPVIQMKCLDEWGDDWEVICPACQTPRNVEADANYRVTCESCKQEYQVKSIF